MYIETMPDAFKKKLKEDDPKVDIEAFMANQISFTSNYQGWYSEAKSLIRQILPDRFEDFVRLYEKPKNRKSISHENYAIEDYLQDLNVTRGGERVVGPSGAIPRFIQQIAILKSVNRRFESSLFDIRQLVQADLLDGELNSASELIKSGFLRSAGVVAGVVLEKHLAQVLINHKISTKKAHPTISDFNDLLKGDVLDTPTWRKIQHLGDLRNLACHGKGREPTREEMEDLKSGVAAIVKTLF